MNKIIEKAKTVIPSVDKILNKAIDNLQIRKLSSDKILKNFEEIVRKINNEDFRIYRAYEDSAFRTLIKLWKQQNKRMTQKNLEKLVRLSRELEFKAGQMRKARGGASFQKIIQKLLNFAGIPCAEPHKETRQILRRIDLVSPSAEVGKETPDQAIFLAVKRTLRERWKQIVPEQMKGARLYLVTINGECSEEKAKEIKETGMIAYVPEKLKKQKRLQDKTWIRPLTDLPRDIKSMLPKKFRIRQLN